jgi:predicted nucleic acid-binding protein
MVLVDSSAWIEALRRSGRVEVKLAVEGLLEAYAAVWCSPVRLEVLGGARREERRRLGHYFSMIPYRPTSEEDFEQAVSLAWKLRDGGLTVPWLDVLITAVALREGWQVYAVEEHFPKIAAATGLSLYHPGYGGLYQD